MRLDPGPIPEAVAATAVAVAEDLAGKVPTYLFTGLPRLGVVRPVMIEGETVSPSKLPPS